MSYSDNNLVGYFYQGDHEMLKMIAERLPDSGFMVEIGTYMGRSARFWAEEFRRLNKNYIIYCLDLYNTTGDFFWDTCLKNRSAGDIKLCMPLVKKQKTHLELTKQFLKSYPEIAVLEYDIFKNKPEELGIKEVTCVFDDCLHTQEGVKTIFNQWYHLLIKGGIYCGHDYSIKYPEVMAEVNRLANENNLQIVKPSLNSSVYFLQ